MRMWHYKLLPYLPDKQFKGQLRELIAIKRNWERNGTPNHLLVNKVIEYHKAHFGTYFLIYCEEYEKRYGKSVKDQYKKEVKDFCGIFSRYGLGIFFGWHDTRYLRICMANLFEKYVCKGLSEKEWEKVKEGYENITGEEYVL